MAVVAAGLAMTWETILTVIWSVSSSRRIEKEEVVVVVAEWVVATVGVRRFGVQKHH